MRTIIYAQVAGTESVWHSMPFVNSPATGNPGNNKGKMFAHLIKKEPIRSSTVKNVNIATVSLVILLSGVLDQNVNAAELAICNEKSGVSQLREFEQVEGIDAVGRKVMTKAKLLDVSAIALMARYFKNGEHGLPHDEQLSACLYQDSYLLGNNAAAPHLSQILVENGQFKEAATMLGIGFGYWHNVERQMIVNGTYEVDDLAPMYSHMLYGQYQQMLDSAKGDPQPIEQAFNAGVVKMQVKK
ncbi:hypothetical protein [Shewanella aestuarii]|uniref:Uncharacterized protein n=1 Tax=Shewanella aestuarii TaxID=1028752 RepID=A0A6G9QQ18_9GAMM|nr:hypothetical protein [Shewanella aestuarii]QIR16562.1 hypothetical protein HBH39_18990 [Shewanella aestuarii]